MKHLLLSILIPLPLLFGCGEAGKTVHELIGFISSTLEMPETMLCVEKGHVSIYHYDQGHPTLVYYYGPDECSDCAIGRMARNMELLDWGEQSGLFSVMHIMAPMEDRTEEVIERLLKSDFDFPVYIDNDYILEDQSVIPKDSRLHAFMLDHKGKPSLTLIYHKPIKQSLL